MKKIVLALMCMLLVIPAFAQDDATDFTDEELEMIDYVLSAFEQFQALESYSLNGTVVNLTEGEADGEETPMLFDQSVSGVILMRDGNPYAGQVVTESTFLVDGQSEFPPMTSEMIEIEGEVYIRNGDDPWVNMTNNPVMASQLEANQTAIGLLPTGAPIAREFIESIEQLEPSETENGQALRVFSVGIDTLALFESGEINATLDDIIELPQSGQDMISRLEESAEITVTLYIGEDDLLIHRMEQIMTYTTDFDIMGSVTTIFVTMDYDLVFSDFNEPVEITAPVE